MSRTVGILARAGVIVALAACAVVAAGIGAEALAGTLAGGALGLAVPMERGARATGRPSRDSWDGDSPTGGGTSP